MFLQLPSYCPENRNIHCIVSPRSHHAETLQNIHNTPDQFPASHNKKHLKCSSQNSSPFKIALNNTEIHSDKDIDVWTRPFQQLIYSKSFHLKHSRTLSVQSPQNKFYSFKKIREEKCKEQNVGGKVIKSLRFQSENEKPMRKKVIEHLDDVTTIESQNSPRSSLNSMGVPEIQQSQIIMKGADLYENLMKENKLQYEKTFGYTKTADSIYQTPEVRKDLGQSNYWINRQNRLNMIHGNCMTDPRQVPYMIGRYGEQEETNAHSFLKYLNTSNREVENNKLSFLKARKGEKRW